MRVRTPQGDEGVRGAQFDDLRHPVYGLRLKVESAEPHKVVTLIRNPLRGRKGILLEEAVILVGDLNVAPEALPQGGTEVKDPKRGLTQGVANRLKGLYQKYPEFRTHHLHDS
jgi:hypothetical protein